MSPMPVTTLIRLLVVISRIRRCSPGTGRSLRQFPWGAVSSDATRHPRHWRKEFDAPGYTKVVIGSVTAVAIASTGHYAYRIKRANDSSRQQAESDNLSLPIPPRSGNATNASECRISVLCGPNSFQVRCRESCETSATENAFERLNGRVQAMKHSGISG